MPRSPKTTASSPLVFDSAEVCVVERDREYLVNHVQNARFFVTNQEGVTLFTTALAEWKKGRDLSCSRRESQFLQWILQTGFFRAATDLATDRPAVVSISVTERCNLECRYCFYSASPHNRDAKHISTPDMAKLHRFLAELRSINPKARVYLTGGEPFARRDICRYFEAVKAAGLYAGVVTNGTLITRELAHQMSELGVNEVRISIDGASQEVHERTRPGTYDRVIRTLNLLREYRIPVTITPTVTSANQSQLSGLATLARQYGAYLSLSPGVPTGRARDNKDLLPDYEKLVQEMVRIDADGHFNWFDMHRHQGHRVHSCGLAGQSLYISLDGIASPCNMLARSGINLGNVFETGLREVIESETARKHRVTVDEIEFCSDCHVRYVCGGPCRASALFAAGSMRTRGPDCALKYAEVIEGMFQSAPRLMLKELPGTSQPFLFKFP